MNLYIITSRSIQKIKNDLELGKMIKYYYSNNIDYKLKFTNDFNKLLDIKKELQALAS